MSACRLLHKAQQGLDLPEYGLTLCVCSGGFYVQYECLEKLGEGAFGEALKARRRKVRWLTQLRLTAAVPVLRMLQSCVRCRPPREQSAHQHLQNIAAVPALAICSRRRGSPLCQAATA